MSPALSRAAWVRIIPFAAFMLLLAARGTVPGDGSWGFDPRWIYAITVVIVGGLLAALSREYGELARQTGLGEAFVGSLFIAITTSLPEIAVSLAAVRAVVADDTA